MSIIEGRQAAAGTAVAVGRKSRLHRTAISLWAAARGFGPRKIAPVPRKGLKRERGEFDRQRAIESAAVPATVSGERDAPFRPRRNSHWDEYPGKACIERRPASQETCRRGSLNARVQGMAGARRFPSSDDQAAGAASARGMRATTPALLHRTGRSPRAHRQAPAFVAGVRSLLCSDIRLFPSSR